jgi:hypothetical protein
MGSSESKAGIANVAAGVANKFSIAAGATATRHNLLGVGLSMNGVGLSTHTARQYHRSAASASSVRSMD